MSLTADAAVAAADDFGETTPITSGSTPSKSKKKKHKKKKSNMDFDEQWDSIKVSAKKRLSNTPSDPDTQSKPDDKGSGDDNNDESGDTDPSNPPKLKRKKSKLDAKKQKTIHAAVQTKHELEYGTKHDNIRKSRAETKAIKEKRKKEWEDRERQLAESAKKAKEAKEAKKKKVKSIRDTVETKHEVEYGMKQDEIAKQRAEIKAIKEKRRREREEQQKEQNKKPIKISTNPSARDRKQKSMDTKGNELEYGISEEVLKKRQEIKELKKKKSKNDLHNIGNTETNDKDKDKNKENTNDNNEIAVKVNSKRRLSKLKQNNTMEPTIDIYQSQIAILKEENVELKKQLKMSEFIKKKYELLKNENTLFKQQVSVLNEENEALRKELNELKVKFNVQSTEQNVVPKSVVSNDGNDGKLDDDHKEENDDSDGGEEEEEEEEVNEKANGNDNSKKLLTLHTNDSDNDSESENEWEEWEANQICDWILSLDSKFNKYAKVLKKNLNEEEWHGSLLTELRVNDLERLGITNKKHQRTILWELKKMVKVDIPFNDGDAQNGDDEDDDDGDEEENEAAKE